MINRIVSAILLGLALAAAGYFWYQSQYNPQIVTTIEYVSVPEIKEVIKIKRVEVPVEKIVTIEKEVLVEKIKLPEWFIENADKQAIATAVIPPYEGDTNAVAIVDTKTGVGEIVIKREPLPLMGFVNAKELYGKLGYNTKSELIASVGGRWLFARVGEIKFGLYGEGEAGFNSKSQSDTLRASAGVIVTF